jgi:flagellin-like hook-associated protein FlgL
LFTLGVMNNLVLEERNDSGVWGTVDLDYHGDRPQYVSVKTADPDPDLDPDDPENTAIWEVNYSVSNNSAITVFPGGLRPDGAHSVVMQEWDIQPVTPGVNCDYNGTFHGKVTGTDSPAGVSIELYKDGSNTVMSARNDPDEALVNGKAVLYAVDKHGAFALDANKERIVVGSVALPLGVDPQKLPEGASESFEVKTGGLRNGGQEREENVFATMNDIMDALDTNDKDALHDLLGKISVDEDRVLSAQGDASARWDRLELLSERHADDVLNFTATLTSRVGMDDQALSRAIMDYQASTNAYQAAMDVSARVMQMSLLQYLQ